ncbi:MAG: RluA family pseudouridine synthase [Betaproteobacteria bacterium]|nr:RluA family pseudouridine synthase [Betaproteobacteria bacterium]
MKVLSKVPEITRQVVGESSTGQRIDNFLVRLCKGVPKSHIYRVLRSGEVRVNSRRVAPDYRLQSGDEVRVPPMRMAAPESGRKAPGRSFPVLFEDDHLLVIDKPAGVAVHGGSGVSFGVIEQLRTARPEERFLELAHRLDRETSGVLVLAKTRRALLSLHGQLREGGAHKSYLALVQGRWTSPQRDVRLPLHKYVSESGERRVVVAAEGKESRSMVRLLARWSSASLVEVELMTGRTHQIRVHLAHLGYPIRGDDKYGDFAWNRQLQREGLKRMFLHAARMRLRHPVTGAMLEVKAPLPKDLRDVLGALERCEKREYGETLRTDRL